MGQRIRTIEQTIKEQQRGTWLNRFRQSAVAQHIHESGHKVDFDGVEVLASVKNYHRRLIREAIVIYNINLCNFL